MAASKAPHLTTITTTTPTTATLSVTTTSSTSLNSSSKALTSPSTSSSTILNPLLTSNISNTTVNFHELCRSCGKTNDELYDLFQQTTNLVTTAAAAASATTAASPFNTSTTTCYAHLTNKPTTTLETSSASSLTAFDSVAATAKATAKGQSNMDNILQEMQIWQLMIKCNDGLPQRICAKCTAQFYMIHKFRRKCLKVQTQLRTLYEEQQQQQQHQQQQHKYQQEQEASVENRCEKQDETIDADESKPQIDIVTPSGDKTHKDEDHNDSAYNNVETEDQQCLMQQREQREAVVDDNDTLSVCFETPAQAVDTTLLDNVVAASLPKDEKKPLLLDSGSLLLPSQAVCDNERKSETTETTTTLQEKLENTKNISTPNTLEPVNDDDAEKLQQIEDPSNVKNSQQIIVNTENVFITKAALKAYSNTNLNLSVMSNQSDHLTTDQDNTRLSQEEQINNVCSSTSNLVSPSCSSTTSTLNQKPVKRRRRKTHKNKTPCSSSHKSKTGRKQKAAVTIKSKLKSSRRNKLTFKNLSDVRTCLSTAKSTRKPVRKQKSRYVGRPLPTEDESSSSSTSSSSAVSTTSTISAPGSSSCSTALSSSATTPAVTDLFATQNLAYQTGFSALELIERTASNKTVSSMWKTKAAMKANATDDLLVSEQLQQSALLTGSQTTTSSLASSSSSSSSSLMDDENKSLKTPKANHNTTTTTTTITTATTTTTTTAISTNSLHSLNDHEFKEDNDDNDGNVKNVKENTNENQQPEEVEQKQIEIIAAAQTLQNDDDDDQKTIEILPKNNVNNEEQKPIVSTTPPAKTGCMKLILQRKRGTRFTCRRKNDNDNNDDEEHLQPTVSSKRRRKSLPSRSKSFSFTNDCDNNLKNFEEITMASDKMDRDPSEATTNSRSGFLRVTGDENKENPALHECQQELDADSNLSIYRDPLLLRNDINEDDTNLADFPQNQLALHTECSKEMYRIYKEKTNLESPKKLIVRVPLTSLTQDFKKLHLTMEEQESKDEDQESLQENLAETNQPEAESISSAQSQPNNDSNNENCSSGSDLLGFSQSTADSPTSSSSTNSSQYSVEAVRCVEPPLCSASSKINDFINDFQNNCIDSSEIEDSSEDTALPHLTPRIAQELSDEIRDVEDTLNGILSEMHDKDMYTPRSGTTDEFFAHSVYSPLTDTPTTPAHSFYAESPCTINSNPMSVSPFIHQNMDYNAMTPQSNHSSMGHGSQMGLPNSNPNNGIFSEHFTSYKECFEESNQSELIGFQNDIPCFENIDLVGKAETAEDLLATTAEMNEEPVITNNHTEVQTDAEEQIEQKHQTHQPHVVDYIDLSEFKETNEESSTTEVPNSPTEIVNPHIAYTANSYPQQQTLPLMTHENSSFISNTTTQPHYIVTNTNQGPILITNSSLGHSQEQIDAAFKPHSNNLQFITLGQAMEGNRQIPANHLMHNTAADLNWPATMNAAPSSSYQQQPLLTTTTNGTTTYFINANGELYQASVPSSSMRNTILVPSQATQNSATSIAFGKATNDNNEGFVQNPTHQANAATTAPSSQYIMVVNNVTGAPQYYATSSGLNQTPVATAANITPPAVLYQPTPAATTNTGNLNSNLATNSSTPTIDSNNRRTPNLVAKQRPEPPAPTATKQSTFVPITPALPSSADNPNQTMHQRINQQLQRQIRERQLQLSQVPSPNSPQKITLICRFCHKRPKFTNNVDYSNHIINMHPAEKPYNCPHCPMNFSRRFERQQHVAQVHGSRYQCAQCGLSFCAQRALDFHLQKYHANLGSRTQEDQQQEQGQHQLQQSQNSTSGMVTPATYQLLHQNQQQRLVRVEDVHVQMSDENKNKRSIDLSLDSADMKTSPAMQDVDLLSISSGNSLQCQQQTRKLCCPDCNGDNEDCCGGSHRNNDQKVQQRQPGFAGNESVNNRLQQQQQQQQLQLTQHVTIPSPEQTEPDSTTTLRHFRKRQLSEISSVYSSTPALSSSSTTTTSSNSANGYSLSTNSDNSLAGDEGVEQHQQQQQQQQQQQPQQQIVVERTLRDTHNCLLCEESFTNEIALRKHHHLAHGTQTMATSNTVTTSLVCNICKRGFRMRNALQRHMETHDAEGRPYECNICHVRFPRPSQLTLHKLTVHKFEKPNSCNECGKQFGTESAMKAHTKVHAEAAKTISATTTTKTALATISTVAVPATSSSSSSSLSSSSSSSFSPTPQLSNCVYLDTMATAITTTTTSSNSNASSSTAANEQNINLQSTTSGESTTTTTMTNNNNNNAAAAAASASVASVANHVYNNNATQNTIVVSGLTT